MLLSAPGAVNGVVGCLDCDSQASPAASAECWNVSGHSQRFPGHDIMQLSQEMFRCTLRNALM